MLRNCEEKLALIKEILFLKILYVCVYLWYILTDYIIINYCYQKSYKFFLHPYRNIIMQ